MDKRFTYTAGTEHWGKERAQANAKQGELNRLKEKMGAIQPANYMESLNWPTPSAVEEMNKVYNLICIVDSLTPQQFAEQYHQHQAYYERLAAVQLPDGSYPEGVDITTLDFSTGLFADEIAELEEKSKQDEEGCGKSREAADYPHW